MEMTPNPYPARPTFASSRAASRSEAGDIERRHRAGTIPAKERAVLARRISSRGRFNGAYTGSRRGTREVLGVSVSGAEPTVGSTPKRRDSPRPPRLPDGAT